MVDYREVLRNALASGFGIVSVERYWSSTKVNEEREKTRSEEIISNERESNIAMEHDVASNSFRTQILDPVDNISAFFKDPSGVKVTKFIEKLQELSDDSGIISDESKKMLDEEDKVEYESQNSPSVSNDNDSEYIL
ncbi:hypothetical protein Glove_645g36 [Diversispora epigaea]|uniref:Uncharacterized protein n=1 Tax=Diversispora epigaea TaxID=1348612 RepID=A0A397G918_9GLOM|nr:hypothetical protein Glove_645g36 [Diversispora epigaea]